MSISLAILEATEGANSVVQNQDGTYTVYDKYGIEMSYDREKVQVIAADIEAREKLNQLRYWRDEKLKETDWVVVKAQELGTDVPDEWKSYRQALRDITNTYTSFEEAVWPIKPE